MHLVSDGDELLIERLREVAAVVEPVPPSVEAAAVALFERRAALHIPGPCPLPARVRAAVGAQMINTRGPEFAELLCDCEEGVRSWLATDRDVLFLSASGTGALEAAVANLLSPGDQALFASMGWFGDMWAKIARALGVDVVGLTVPWGEAIEPGALADALDRHPHVRAVFVTHNETSTGVRNDLPAIAAVVKERGLLLAVDSISGAPGHPLAIDELGLDVAAFASQKGWLAPPGLAMVVVSEAALRAGADARCPRYYFDFALLKAQQERGLTHMTPPLPAMYGLREGLAMLLDEGHDAVWQRHRQVGAIVRAGVRALGLSTVARSGLASETVTAVRSPFESPSDLAALLASLKRRGLVVADGVGPFGGRAFRIGHMGAVSTADAARVIDRLAAALPARLAA